MYRKFLVEPYVRSLYARERSLKRARLFATCGLSMLGIINIVILLLWVDEFLKSGLSDVLVVNPYFYVLLCGSVVMANWICTDVFIEGDGSTYRARRISPWLIYLVGTLVFMWGSIFMLG